MSGWEILPFRAYAAGLQVQGGRRGRRGRRGRLHIKTGNNTIVQYRVTACEQCDTCLIVIIYLIRMIETLAYGELRECVRKLESPLTARQRGSD